MVLPLSLSLNVFEIAFQHHPPSIAFFTACRDSSPWLNLSLEESDCLRPPSGKRKLSLPVAHSLDYPDALLQTSASLLLPPPAVPIFSMNISDPSQMIASTGPPLPAAAATATAGWATISPYQLALLARLQHAANLGAGARRTSDTDLIGVRCPLAESKAVSG